MVSPPHNTVSSSPNPGDTAYRAKKLAILSGTSQQFSVPDWVVSIFHWDKLDKLPNLRDFDALLIDLTTCPISGNVRWSKLFNKLSLKTFIDITGHGGEVIILGNPDMRCVETIGTTVLNDRPFLHWTGLEFVFDHGIGDTIEITSDGEKHSRFLKRITKYERCIEDVHVSMQSIEKALTKSDLDKLDFEVNHRKLAVNRFKKAIASEIFLVVERTSGGAISSTTLADQFKSSPHFFFIGPLTLVPEFEATPEDLLRCLIDEVVGIPLQRQLPDWVNLLEPVHQDRIDKSIIEVEKEIELLELKKETLLSERTVLRDCLRLLFDDGQKLEEIARNALAELGATVENPIETNKEDGWISVTLKSGTVLEGVLEVKSTEKENFNESGIRQLGEWKVRGTLPPREKRYKGIFVGSNSIKELPQTRAVGFSDSLKKSACLNDLVLLKGESLYVVLMLHRLSQLDTDEFWSELFSTQGVFEAEKYHAKLKILHEASLHFSGSESE